MKILRLLIALALLSVAIPAFAQTSGQTMAFTANGTSQQVLASNSNRRNFIIQNNSTTITVYASCGVAATTGMMAIIPGGNWEPSMPCLGAVNVITSGSNAAIAVTDY